MRIVYYYLVFAILLDTQLFKEQSTIYVDIYWKYDYLWQGI